MKNILISIIKFYQNFLSIALKNILGMNRMCRYSPTCSEYAIKTINRDGVLRGIKKSTVRILKCQPFSK